MADIPDILHDVAGQDSLSLSRDLQPMVNELKRMANGSGGFCPIKGQRPQYIPTPSTARMPFDVYYNEDGILAYWGGRVVYGDRMIDVGSYMQENLLSDADSAGYVIVESSGYDDRGVPASFEVTFSDNNETDEDTTEDEELPVLRLTVAMIEAPVDKYDTYTVKQCLRGNIIVPPHASENDTSCVAGLVCGIDVFSPATSVSDAEDTDTTAVEGDTIRRAHLSDGKIRLPLAEMADVTSVEDISAVDCVAGLLRTARVVTYDAGASTSWVSSIESGPARAELHDGNLTLYVPNGGTSVGVSFSSNVCEQQGDVRTVQEGASSQGWHASVGNVYIPRANCTDAGASQVAGVIKGINVFSGASAIGWIDDGTIQVAVPNVTTVGCSYSGSSVGEPGVVQSMQDCEASQGWHAVDGDVYVPRANCTDAGASQVAGVVKGISVSCDGATPVGWIEDGTIHVSVPSATLAQDGTAGLIRGISIVEGGVADPTSATISDGIITIVIRNLANY